jgi:hypothetical protein
LSHRGRTAERHPARGVGLGSGCRPAGRGTGGGPSRRLVAPIERLDILDRQQKAMPTEGDRELIEEPDLAEDHLPRRRSPLAEEANLCLPFHSRHPWLRSEPERHVGGMDESLLTTDLQRSGMIRIGRDPDLPCHARSGENSLSTRVHEGEEGRVIVRFRPGERDADHRPVHDAPGGMCRSACYVLGVKGRSKGRAAGWSRRRATRGQQARLDAPARSVRAARWHPGFAWTAVV